MRFAVLVKANKDSESGVMPTTEQLAAMGKFNEQLINDGIMLAGEGLQPTSKGVRLRYEGGRTTVTEGPFPATGELVAGFWLVKGKSQQDIVERFKRAPFDNGQEIEIRKIFEAEDFGENLTPELREQEERLRAASRSAD